MFFLPRFPVTQSTSQNRLPAFGLEQCLLTTSQGSQNFLFLETFQDIGAWASLRGKPRCSMISGAGPPFHRRDFRGRAGGVGSYTLIGNVGCSCAFGLSQTKRGSAVEDPTPEIMEIAVVVVCMGPGPRSMGGNN